MIDWTKPTILEGEKVRLIPLTLVHREDLLNAVTDGDLGKLWFTYTPTEDTVDDYIGTALEDKAIEKSLPFVVIHKDSNKVIGTTRYCRIDAANRRLEIGYTWYSKSFQRTGVNTECKYLLLKNAFENYNAIAVEFRTHWFNYRSRNAILRIGAKQDGVLRNHRVDKDGNLRDTVVFSIIESEWKMVKKSLEFEMGKY